MDDEKKDDLVTSVTANSSPTSSDDSVDRRESVEEYITHDGEEEIEHHEEDVARPPLARTRSNRSYASGAEGYADITLARTKTGTSLSRVQTSDPAYEVDWEEGDKGELLAIVEWRECGH